MFNKTKIIATIGPSSNTSAIIRKMIKKGMNVARLNMAHSVDITNVESLVSTIRAESRKLDKHVGILMDIAGPKIRIDLSNIESKKIKIVKNNIYSIGFSNNSDIKINMNVSYEKIKGSNSFVRIDDGKISFKILSKIGQKLQVKAINSGTITSNKGINFPGVDLNIPSITKNDKKHIKLGLKLGVDWFALSFVRSRKDYNDFIKLYTKNNTVPIVAKIEKPEAMKNLDEIIKTFDGILIARGDLGVEMELSRLPIIQKQIIKRCKLEKKPIIIATQILESMIQESIPTRAEVNDVANAVYEQVDAVMLSGETAIGKYPLEAIKIMKDIILNIESEDIDYQFHRINPKSMNPRYAIGEAVKTITNNLDVHAIVVMSESGATSKIVSSIKPKANIFSLCPYNDICNRMSLFWGIISIKTKEYPSTDEMLNNSESILLEKKYIKKGQTFVMTAGIPVGVTGSTNMLKIHKIRKG